MAAVDIARATDLAALTGRVATNEGTLSAAAAAATPATLAKRDGNGRLQVAAPSAVADAATKKYVDDGDTAAKAYADGLGTAAATASTIARRDAAGRLQVADPAVAADAATRGYVDGSLTGFGRDLGAGTSLPTAAPDTSVLRRGDTYFHTTYGALFVWNGTGWRSRGPGELTKAQRTALVTASIPYAGFQVYETDTDRTWQWSGAKWRYVSGGAIPFIKVRRTTVFALVATTWCPIPFETRVNSGTAADDTTDTTMWNSATPTRLIAPIDGLYLATASLYPPASANVYLAFLRNGGSSSETYRKSANNTSVNELAASEPMRLAAGQYVEVALYNGGGSLQTAAEVQNAASLLWLGNY